MAEQTRDISLEKHPVVIEIASQEVANLDTEKNDTTSIKVDLKKLTFKVDCHILPLLFITYSLQFVDKLALSSASVFGIRDDNHLKGDDYSWVSSIFYFGFLLGEFPTSRMLQVVPMGKFIGVAVVLWGIVMACTAACHSYAGLLVVRFFLGVLESCVSPTFVLMTSMWWKKKHQPLRTGIWFAGNDFGGVVSGFVTFGIGHINGKLPSWEYIFILYGSVTVAWGILLFFYLPDSPQSAWFLNEDEKVYYKTEMSQSNINHEWKWYQVKECLLDLKTWLIVSIVVLNILPNGGIISYGYLIIDGFGFPSIDTTLLGVPASVITWIAIVGSGWIASRFPNMRIYAIILTVIPPIVGGSLVYALPSEDKGLRLFGYYLLNIQPASFTLALAMVASNYTGFTKRTAMGGIVFIFYCAADIGGPQLFKSSEAPRYQTAFKTWIICFAISVFIAMVLRYYLIWENKKRDSEEAVGDIKTGEDLTDVEDKAFRYSY